MRGTHRLIPFACVLATGLAAVTLSLNGVFVSGQASAQTQAQTSIGVDADPTGNINTTLGPRDRCVSVRAGDTFQVDVIIDNVVDLTAWDVYLSFDPALLHVRDRDVQQFLASLPNANPFDISESVPDDDSPYRIGAASISDPPVGISGSGVLARLTLEAVDSGLASLTLGPIDRFVSGSFLGTVRPTLAAADGSHIGDSDGDEFFDGPVLDAQVAIDEACPGSGGGPVAGSVPIGGGGGGVAWWVFLAAAAGAVVTLGAGGAVFVVLRRSGGPNLPS